jgi:ribosomal-protein-alanine N-acetyltransferase
VIALEALAADADCEDLARVHAEAFAQGWTASSIRSSLAQPGAFALVARAGSGCDGFILARVVVDEAEILTLAVRPAKRRKGIGGALVGAAAEEAQMRGARAMFLEVAKTNVAARGLYERLGFAPIGERRSYYRDAPGSEPEDAFAMRAPLPLGKAAETG